MAASFRAPRVLALATTLAVSITCVNPESATNNGGTDNPVADIVVTIAATTIDKGVSTKATAVLHDAAQNVLTGRTVTWSSTNPAVAQVTATTGDVTGLTEGATDIVATSEGVTGQASMSVHITVASVATSLGASSLVVGSTTMAVAVPRDVDGQPLARPVSWSSSNAAIANVNVTTGAVTALAPGSAMIRATCEGMMGQASLSVSTVPVSSVSVTLSASTINVGATTSASAVTRDASNNVLTGRAISWSSTNPAVATVSASGTVTAVSAGSANIRATSEGIAGEATLTVAFVPVASVSVTLGSASLIVAQTTTASAVTRDASNNVLTGRAITWSSDNTAVATVSASGTVTAVSAGSANIRATSEGITGQAAITVSPVPVASVTVTLGSASLAIAGTTTATAVTRDASNNVLTGRAITWSSSNTAVATVSASGTVTAVSVGSANIRATSEGVTGQAAITVTLVPVASVTVTLGSSSLMSGQTTTASAVTRDASNNVLTGRVVTWNSTNTAVATVNASGTVTAVAAGTANIRATSEGVTGLASITVTSVPVASVSVTLGSSSIPAGQTTTATAVTRDASNNVLTGRIVTWSSDNTSTATVSASGLVTAVAIGTATITATSEGVSGSAGVTVTAPPPPPPPGTLRIQVNGLLASATSGGSASVLRTDITGQTPQSVTIPVSGTLDVSLAVGTYSVTFTPPSGYQLASGTSTRTATISSNLTATVTYQVSEVGAAPVGVIFHSDWSTGLGTSENVVLDMGKAVPWDVDGGAGFEAIPSTGLDFPTANVLRVTAQSGNSGFALVRKQTLPVMQVGQSRYYRWYSRVMIPDGAAPSDNETHPHQDGNSSSDSNWLLHLYHDGIGGSANQWTPQISTERDNFDGPALNKNQTYRFEFKYTRTTTSTLTMDIRVYNSAGTLLYTGANYIGEFGSGALNTGTHAVNNASTLGQFNAGLNGLGGSEWFPSVVYMYQGGIAISDTDWLGPYRGGK